MHRAADHDPKQIFSIANMISISEPDPIFCYDRPVEGLVLIHAGCGLTDDLSTRGKAAGSKRRSKSFIGGTLAFELDAK